MQPTEPQSVDTQALATHLLPDKFELELSTQTRAALQKYAAVLQVSEVTAAEMLLQSSLIASKFLPEAHLPSDLLQEDDSVRVEQQFSQAVRSARPVQQPSQPHAHLMSASEQIVHVELNGPVKPPVAPRPSIPDHAVPGTPIRPYRATNHAPPPRRSGPSTPMRENAQMAVSRNPTAAAPPPVQDVPQMVHSCANLTRDVVHTRTLRTPNAQGACLRTLGKACQWPSGAARQCVDFTALRVGNRVVG